MNHKITIFFSKKTKNKHPISPFDDNSFIFETLDLRNNQEMFNVMVSHFILNIPLERLKEPIRTYRRKTNLQQFYEKCINYFILDIDDVKTKEHKRMILEYFKEYKVILGESKSYNGIDNFNLKGILFTECIDFKDTKLALSSIHHDLKDICTIDESVIRKVSLNAPINKNNILLNNESGELWKFNKRESLELINDIKKEYVQSFQTNRTNSDFKLDDIQNIEANTIEKFCLKVFQNMGFEAIKNSRNDSIVFKHPSEKKTPGGYFWFRHSPYTMHHFNSTKTINIFDAVRKIPAARELMKKEINYDDEFLRFNTDTEVISVDERYLKVTQEIKEKFQEFLNEKDGLLSIRSPMGTGKSTLIHEIISEAHEHDMNVLIITNRISVAQDFGKKYQMKVYNQDKYQIGDSLVCQYDSLWKYSIKHFDVVIMDEFISLMLHTRSNLNNSSLNISKFFAAFNKKLVLADAFLTGYENFLLQNKTKNLYLIDNLYRDPTTLYNYQDYNYFVKTLLYHAEKEKITVSCTSLSFIHSLQMLLTKMGKKVIALTADTPESTKSLIYELFEKSTHDKWDVLLYSPTLTVGVSNLNEVNKHFHYDSSMSTDVISSMQMIKRTRKAKEIHLFIRERINYIKTSYNAIRDEYISNIGRNIEQNYLFDVDDYGEARLSNIGKKAIKIDTFKNILEFNHKEAMLWLLKYHFMKEPRIVTDKHSENALCYYQKLIREDSKLAVKNKINEFLELNSIEKTTLLMDSDVDKTLKILAEIDSEIIDCNSDIRKCILECSLQDKNFIQKCKYYNILFNYTKNIWNADDIKSRISRAIIENKKEDLEFLNDVLMYGQNEIHESYLPGKINSNRSLKKLLDKCGYSITKNKKATVIGQRVYEANEDIKKYYRFVR